MQLENLSVWGEGHRRQKDASRQERFGCISSIEHWHLWEKYYWIVHYYLWNYNSLELVSISCRYSCYTLVQAGESWDMEYQTGSRWGLTTVLFMIKEWLIKEQLVSWFEHKFTLLYKGSPLQVLLCLNNKWEDCVAAVLTVWVRHILFRAHTGKGSQL